MVQITSSKTNPKEFQFIILGEFLWPKYCLTIGRITVKEADQIDLLRRTIEKHLSFKKHIQKIFRNVNYKLHAHRSIGKYIAVEKAKLLGNTFIDS